MTILLTQPWIQTLGWTLLHFLWQGALIAALYGLARLMTANRLTARARYGMACAGLLAMAFAPAATYLGLAREASAAATAFELTNVGLRPVALAAWAPAAADPWQQALPWIVVAWLAGVAACSIRLANGWLSAARLHTWCNRTAPPEWQQILERLMTRMRISRPVRLLVSARVESPSVVGWLRPVVLAPLGALTGLATEHVEALLAHELAHIQRHDYLVNVLQGIVESLLFYHPAVWWLSGQIRTEREHCCDDLAVVASGDVLTYARALAELESARPAHFKTALAANDGSLVRRIRRLVDPGAQRPSGSGAAWVLSVLMLLAVGTAIMHGAPEPVQPPTLDLKTAWPDTVKQGDMTVAVRGLGTITSTAAAELRVAESQVAKVRAGQPVMIDCMGKGMVAGRVTNVLPTATEGTVPVDVRLDGALPQGVGLHAKVDATITIRNLTNVVYVGRPVFGASNSRVSLFKIEPDGRAAVRVKVEFGEASVNVIEVKSGLQPGDKVILSDMSAYDKVDRLTLK
jgi:beta-lactamase regulating signal transducer with metallopeptidase domain